MRFTRIRLENWRNFTAVDVPLQMRAFLIGPNASGKSNFLDAFRFLRDLASDGLEKAVNGERRGGVSKIRSLQAGRNPRIAVECELNDHAGCHWSYRVEIKEDSKQHRPILIREVVKKAGQGMLNRPDHYPEDKDDPERLFQTHLEQVSMNREFRPVAEVFKSINYLHLVPQLIRKQDRMIKKQSDPYGSDFLENIWLTDNKSDRERLRSIEKIIKIAVPQFQKLKLDKDKRGIPHLYFNYIHWRKRGAWQTETDQSDGTIRLLGLLWALLEGRGLLLLEEPELSLHPEVVCHLPEMMYRLAKRTSRQIIVSTHSVEMLMNQGIAADEILLLSPSNEGTKVQVGVTIEDVKNLMEGGLSAAEAALPHTQPEGLDRLSSSLLEK